MAWTRHCPTQPTRPRICSARARMGLTGAHARIEGGSEGVEGHAPVGLGLLASRKGARPRCALCGRHGALGGYFLFFFFFMCALATWVRARRRRAPRASWPSTRTAKPCGLHSEDRRSAFARNPARAGSGLFIATPPASDRSQTTSESDRLSLGRAVRTDGAAPSASTHSTSKTGSRT